MYREGGFDGLVPAPRRVANGTSEQLLELALALRREQSARTAAQIHRIIVEAEGDGAVSAHDPASLGGGWAAVEWKPDRACARAARGRAALEGP